MGCCAIFQHESTKRTLDAFLRANRLVAVQEVDDPTSGVYWIVLANCARRCCASTLGFEVHDAGIAELLRSVASTTGYERSLMSRVKQQQQTRRKPPAATPEVQGGARVSTSRLTGRFWFRTDPDEEKLWSLAAKLLKCTDSRFVRDAANAAATAQIELALRKGLISPADLQRLGYVIAEN